MSIVTTIKCRGEGEGGGGCAVYSQNGSRHDQGSGIEAEVKQIEYNISFR